MRTAQLGDQVLVHYVKRLQDGSRASSRGRPPLQLTIGVGHPRLPGLGSALVGLAVGQSTTLRVAPELAYGLRDPSRVRDVDRKRFPPEHALVIGKWAPLVSQRGRRLVRIVAVRDDRVVIDGNHRGAGQEVELKVKMLAIRGTAASPERPAAEQAFEDGSRTSERCLAITFDVDPASLASLRCGLPEWQLQEVNGASLPSLRRDWNPVAANLLVIGARASMAETLGLCRSLRSQSGRAHTPLLVLVPPGADTLVKAALEAGANSCLVLPVHAKDLARMVARAQQGNRPGRHTLGLERAQVEDRWRDEGGEG